MRFIKAATPEGPWLGVLRTDDVVALSSRDSALEEHFGDDGERLDQLGKSILAAPADEAQVDTLVYFDRSTPSRCVTSWSSKSTCCPPGGLPV